MHSTRTARLGRRLLSPEDPLRSLPPAYLRAWDPQNFDQATGQRRNLEVYDRETGKPLLLQQTKKNDVVQIQSMQYDGTNRQWHITWKPDGHTSTYDESWVQRHVFGVPRRTEGRVLWKDWTEEHVRQNLSISFPDVLQDPSKALQAIYQYGLLLIPDTPMDEHPRAIQALAGAVSGGSVKTNETSLYQRYLSGQDMNTNTNSLTEGPMRTLYGSVWSTSTGGQPVGTSTADSAYGHEALPLHTDFTYYRDPPGLQIFGMIQPAPNGGGASVFCDGFCVAHQLRHQHEESFDLLAKTIRHYQSLDVGWHLQASGPIIQWNSDETEIVAIRHNDLDRLPDCFPNDYEDLIQTAHDHWNALLADDAHRLVLHLQAGETVVVANQRVLHGRTRFDLPVGAPPRSMGGCYVSQDELNSRLRMEGYRVHY